MLRSVQVRSDLATNLRVERARRRISAQELADLAGVSRVTVARIETQPGYSPSRQTVAALSKALRVPIARLTGRDRAAA
jgi:transcriptional regulator with XRE-family HTH domain